MGPRLRPVGGPVESVSADLDVAGFDVDEERRRVRRLEIRTAEHARLEEEHLRDSVRRRRSLSVVLHGEDAGEPDGVAIERSATMGTKIVAVLAVAGGVGLAVASAPVVFMLLAQPDIRAWDLPANQFGWTRVIGEAGLVALGVSVGGAVVVLIDRMHWAVAIAGVVATTGTVPGELGVYSMWILLPIGSSIVAMYLARIRAVHSWIALLHVLSAAGFLLLLSRYFANAPVGLTAIFVPIFAINWSVIGLELARGLQTEPRAVHH
jgi:hypothetical protein